MTRSKPMIQALSRVNHLASFKNHEKILCIQLSKFKLFIKYRYYISFNKFIFTSYEIFDGIFSCLIISQITTAKFIENLINQHDRTSKGNQHEVPSHFCKQLGIVT